VTGTIVITDMIKSFENVCIHPSIYFYPITWHGINSIDKHKTIDIPKESYMFQYGYTTNKLQIN
jgi:hypothetical protein